MTARRRGARRSKAAAGEGENPAAAPNPARVSRAASGLKPDVEEILAAIESLYVSRLKPFGRILRKRLAERAAPEEAALALRVPPQEEEGSVGKAKSNVNTLPDIDVKHLEGVCKAHEQLVVSPEEGGDWSAVFVDRPQDFVDIYSSDDTYDEEFWAQAKAYFGSLPKEAMLLPGGRYSCAQMLQHRGLPFLAEFSLGQICHFVQICISSRKVLGYLDGSVVPYAHSQSMIKELCAVSQQPCGAPCQEGTAAAALPFATWDVARSCLREILDAARVPGQGPAMVPLSNVKRLFRSRYNVELSETALGHSKLSELLHDERFRDICHVQLQGQGYIVVQASDDKKDTFASLIESLVDPVIKDPMPSACQVGATAETMEAPRRVEFCKDEPLDLENAGYFLGEEWTPLALHGSTPLPSPGVPTSCTVRGWGDAACAAEGVRSMFLQHGAQLAACAAPGLPSRGGALTPVGEPRRVKFCADEPLGLEEDPPGFPCVPFATPLPSPGVPTSTTTRRWQPRAGERPGDVLGTTTLGTPTRGGDSAATATLATAIAAGIGLAAGTAAAAEVVRAASTTSGWQPNAPPSWQPGRFKPQPMEVQNTFIHKPVQPPTPVSGARTRSSSLPAIQVVRGPLAADQKMPAAVGFVARPSASASEQSATDSTADTNSAGSAPARAGVVLPSSPATSTGSPPDAQGDDQPALKATPDSTPVKVSLMRLESLGCLPGEGLRTPLPWTGTRRALFCPDEPLSLEDAGIFVDGTPRRRASQWTVQKTFIHADVPRTPAPGEQSARRRARSVPADAASTVRPCTGSPAAQPLRRLQQTDGDSLSATMSIDALPAFVPQSPALAPPTPQSPLFGGGGCWSRAQPSIASPIVQAFPAPGGVGPRGCAAGDLRIAAPAAPLPVLRLSDYIA